MSSCERRDAVIGATRMLKCLLISSALVVMTLSSAAAGGQVRLGVCEWKTRGIVAATPCITRLVREAAASGAVAPTPAQWFREEAAAIEVIADKRRAGEINEEEAVAAFNQLLDKYNELQRKWQGDENNRVAQEN